MATVVRFALSTARSISTAAGDFVDGYLDIDANNITAVEKARYLVQPYRAVELGVMDASTPKGPLPAVPEPPVADPYPQYLLPGELGPTITVIGSGASPVTDPNHPRPAGVVVGYWICAAGVTPINAVAGDQVTRLNP